MTKDVDYYLNLPYAIEVKRLDDGEYFAQYTDTWLVKNNLMAGWGKSEDEAVSELREAFACYVEDALAKNEKIYEPVCCHRRFQAS